MQCRHIMCLKEEPCCMFKGKAQLAIVMRTNFLNGDEDAFGQLLLAHGVKVRFSKGSGPWTLGTHSARLACYGVVIWGMLLRAPSSEVRIHVQAGRAHIRAHG